MASDNFPGQSSGAVSAPSDRFAVLTPDDDNDLAEVPKFIAIGATGGVLAVHDRDGNVVSFEVAAGQVLPIRPYRLLEATTAEPVIACY